MNILLIYFTGTYNTRYISQWLGHELEMQGHVVTLHEIDASRLYCLDFAGYDMIGLGYPIHGYAAPWAFLRFVRYQHFPKGLTTFIYKNSGETERANDASSKFIVRKLRHCGIKVNNEYHFLMPYNIHFRFDENLVREMLYMDAKLMRIAIYEVTNHIATRKRPCLWGEIVCSVVSRPQYIGGFVDSFFYKCRTDKCTHCGLCVNNCPTHNISFNSQGNIHFGHNCLMCMRCSFFCPTAAIDIGFIQGWKVNGRYHFDKILQLPDGKPYITNDTNGFFHCYIRTYRLINERYKQLFGDESCEIYSPKC